MPTWHKRSSLVHLICLPARWHKAIIWNNVDLPSIRSFGICSRGIFTWMLMISIPKLKFTHLKSLPHLLSDKELSDKLAQNFLVLSYFLTKIFGQSLLMGIPNLNGHKGNSKGIPLPIIVEIYYFFVQNLLNSLAPETCSGNFESVRV